MAGAAVLSPRSPLPSLPLPLSESELATLGSFTSAREFSSSLGVKLETVERLEQLDVSGNDLDWSSLTEGGG